MALAIAQGFFYERKQKMSSSSGKAKMPTVNYDTGGMYGSGTAGKTNSFNPTGFQSNLVKTTENAIPDYLNQMINSTYDSTVFKAQTAQRNKLASQSFENNLINPLAQRGLTRGSSINQMGNEFGKNLINAEQAAMTQEDARVSNILSNLFNYYQIPYSIMTGLQGSAQGLLGQRLQADSAAKQAQAQLYAGIAQGIGSLAGSDKRLKENIELLQTVDGYNIYKFDYIKGAKNQVGVIAQEMLEKQPDCVGIGDDGYYFVDYAKLPIKVQVYINTLVDK